MQETINLPRQRRLEFLPDDFKITTWAKLKPYYDELLKRPVLSAEDLEKWLRDRSELEAVISEEFGWRYIRLSQNSEDTNATEMYQYAVQELMPRITVVEDQLNRLLVNSPFADQLPEEKYFIHVRGVKNEVELFREENIPLYTEDQLKSKDYGAILSQMTIEMEGKQLTLQQASILLEETDRTLRESVYRKINTRQLEDREKLDQLFDELRTLRQQMAVNAGFENYRDFKFKAMGRFDYEVQDCYDFHDSIAQAVLPVLNNLYKFRKSSLRLDRLRPWDLAVDTSGKEPLRPFKNSEDLIEKSIRTLETVHPFFGECLATMDSMQRLDLESRKGKHPGGYNMPLYQSGVPFIFMNASGSIGDLHTLMHESGHAVHAFLTQDYDLVSAKNVPSEVAELASMTMELLTMDYWHIFFDNEDDLRRAKIYQLESALKTLPWVATIDKFQHWIYTHPHHTAAERSEAWGEIYSAFIPDIVDRSDLEDFYNHLWHRQLHIFEVPFYYIEYGMAQLGAIAIWKRFRENPTQALEDYINALKLGYTKTIGEIYSAAGIEFNFSAAYVKELADFLNEEMERVIA